MDAYDYAAGFPGLDRVRIDGSNFEESFDTMHRVVQYVRQHRTPYLIQAKVPLLGHHTSGVRKEFYRTQEDLEKHAVNDPGPKLRQRLLQVGVEEHYLQNIENEAWEAVNQQFQEAVQAPEPDPATVTDHVFAPTPITVEKGQRQPAGGEKIIMVDAALFAIREIMEEFPEAMLYGQDVGTAPGWRISRGCYTCRKIQRCKGVQYGHSGSIHYRFNSWDECCRCKANR